MSYRLAVFGVPSSAPASALAGPFAQMAKELRSENGYEELYLAQNDAESVERTGLRLGYLLAEPAPYGRVSREFFTERWSAFPLFVFVYDDAHGLYACFEHLPEYRSRSIASDGLLVGARNLALDADYPQKRYSRAQLEELLARGEERWTDEESRLFDGAFTAIEVASAQYGFRLRRAELRELAHARTAWALLEGREVPLPPAAGALVDTYLEPYLRGLHGLPERAY